MGRTGEGGGEQDVLTSSGEFSTFLQQKETLGWSAKRAAGDDVVWSSYTTETTRWGIHKTVWWVLGGGGGLPRLVGAGLHRSPSRVAPGPVTIFGG